MFEKKSFHANIHFFLLFQEKIVLLHPISPKEIFQKAE